MNTFGSDQGANLKNKQAFGGLPPHGGSMNTNIVGGHNMTGSNQSASPNILLQQSPTRMRPKDPKGGLEWDIEQERNKIQQMEERYRQDLNRFRKDHLVLVGDLEL